MKINSLIIVLVLILIIEYDRNYSISWTVKDYYSIPGMPMVGLYNNLIRVHTPNHPAIMYDVHNWFPRHYLLKDNWQVISKEVDYIYRNYQLPKMHELSSEFNKISDNKWSVFVLKWYSDPSDKNCELAPYTCNILKQLPEIRACMFSIIGPGNYIPPHKGPYKGSLRYHLALKVPKEGDCYIEVDNTKYYWKEGEDIVFDDTYIHKVVNNTSETRIVLFCDVDRPMVGPINKLNSILNSNASLHSWFKEVNSNGEKIQMI